MGTPYLEKFDWRMSVFRCLHRVNKNVIVVPLPPLILDFQNVGRRVPDILIHYGIQFEKISTSGKNPNSKYMKVVDFEVGQFTVLIAGEIDAATQDGEHMELKLSVESTNEFRRQKFKREKLLRYYIQSSLCDVPTICVGFRSDSGRLLRLHEVKTNEIPQEVHRQDWNRHVCDTFLHSVIEWLMQITQEDGCTKGALEYDSRQPRHVRFTPDEGLEWPARFIEALE
eukprot:Filipodium_phascolosomae@DN386_c0_g1_i1.p1